MRRARWAGLGALVLLGGLSLVSSQLAPGLAREHCALGADLVHPDRTVCELAFGGLWVSLAVGLIAGALATLGGLVVAGIARTFGGWSERALLSLADASFSLPDVLVLMVLQFALQTLGDLKPAFRLSPFTGMVISLALVGWAGPARMIRNRLWTLEGQDFVTASRALGATRFHIVRIHLWPALRGYVLALFLTRVPAAILAESTVSFLGIARMEPMSLGRYLGTSYAALMYSGGSRVVLPAWGLLVALVLACSLAGRAEEQGP